MYDGILTPYYFILCLRSGNNSVSLIHCVRHPQGEGCFIVKVVGHLLLSWISIADGKLISWMKDITGSGGRGFFPFIWSLKKSNF